MDNSERTFKTVHIRLKPNEEFTLKDDNLTIINTGSYPIRIKATKPLKKGISENEKPSK